MLLGPKQFWLSSPCLDLWYALYTSCTEENSHFCQKVNLSNLQVYLLMHIMQIVGRGCIQRHNLLVCHFRGRDAGESYKWRTHSSSSAAAPCIIIFHIWCVLIPATRRSNETDGDSITLSMLCSNCKCDLVSRKEEIKCAEADFKWDIKAFL